MYRFSSLTVLLPQRGNKDIANFLKENGFWIVVSLDGTKDNHDRYRVTRGGAPTYDCLMEIIEENFSFYKSIYSVCCYDVTSDLVALTEFYEKMTEEREESFRQYCEPLELTVRLQTSMTIYPKSNL